MPFNLVHRLRLPPAHTPSPYPALVMVHGWLGNENVMWTFQSVLPAGALAISMRAPVEAEGGYGWFPVADAGSVQGTESFHAGLGALREFVRQISKEYPVDPMRVGLIGFSQGAAMSYALLLSDPYLIASTAALAGFLPDPARQWAAPGRLAGKRVFIAHGTGDTTVPIENAVRARDEMIVCDAEVTYREYPSGHKLNTQGMKDLKTWLAAFVNFSPK